MNKRNRIRIWNKLKVLAAGVGGVLLAIFLLQAERPDKTKTVWDVLYEFLTKFAVAVAGFIAAAIGGWGDLTRALVFVMAFDYATGITVACYGKSNKTKSGKLSSSAGFKGLLKKGMILAVVAFANMVDGGAGAGSHDVRNLTCWCYIVNEGWSIFENLNALGVWIPPPLKKVLESMGEKGQGPKLPPAPDDEKKGTGLG